MLKKPVSILLAAAFSLTSACLFPAAAQGDAYLIDDFSGYADTEALKAAWQTQGNVELELTDGALSFGYAEWGDIYTRAVDFSEGIPSDAAGIGLKITAEAAGSLTLKLGYNTSGAEYAYHYVMNFQAGENDLQLAFNDSGWTGVDGWGTASSLLPLDNVKQIMISATGTNAVVIDDIRFLQGKEEEESDPYRIDDFSGYADTAALQGVWGSQGGAAPTVELKNGALSFGYDTNWADIYREVDFSGGIPSDAAGIGLKITAEAAGSLTLKLGYDTGAAYRYCHTINLETGENDVRIAFDDSGWVGEKGWGDVGAMLPLDNVKQLMISAGGTNTVVIDDIRFLKGDDGEDSDDGNDGEDGGDGDEEKPPVETPEEPSLPDDPYVLENFEGYANSASLGYNGLWADNSGGCTVTMALDNGEGNANEGTALKITGTDGGWVTITRSGVTVPNDAASMTFWAKAEQETSLKLEFRLNNNDYKYAPSKSITIGTEGAFYTVYFEDCNYVQGSGGADKGWSLNDQCLVNAINFMRDGYDPITLYLDDITFGKETKPVDPDDPIALLEKAIDTLPAYDDLTVLDIADIETIYQDYAALSADDKRLVANRQALLDAKDLADVWTETLGDRLDDVIGLANGIAALPSEITADDREAVDKLWAVYSKLSEEQKALVPGGEILEKAHQAAGGDGTGSPETGVALPTGAGALALLSAGAAWVLRKRKK